MIPDGVAGAKPSSPSQSRPTLIGWKPSTSFSGSTRWSSSRSGSPAGSGSWTRMPSIASSAFSRSIAARTSASGVSAGINTARPTIPHSSQARVFEPT